MDDELSRRDMVDALRWQAQAEPGYGVLLRALADDVAAGGDTWRPLARLAHLPAGEHAPLRLLGAAHRLALAGEAPAYARHLPSCGGDGDAAAAWPALRDLCATGALDDGVLQPVQTNEPARAASLLPGFALVATETELPLRLLEVGSSAGLLLRFDRYRYTIGARGWGDPASPVHLRCEGEAPLHDLAVVDRRGCDARPLDPVTDRLVLLSFVWPWQLERFRRAEAALALAAEHPVRVDQAGAADWLADVLAEPAPGAATVVFHSIVWQYLGEGEQQAARAAIEQAGARADRGAPLAWLRLEPQAQPELGTELRLTTWPGGEERVLAHCGYHGTPMTWLVP